MKGIMTITLSVVATAAVLAQQVHIPNHGLQERQKKAHFSTIVPDEVARHHARELFKAVRTGSLEAVEQLLHNDVRATAFINLKNAAGQPILIAALSAMHNHLKQAEVDAVASFIKEKRLSRDSVRVFFAGDPLIQHAPSKDKNPIVIAPPSARMQDINRRYQAIIAALVNAGVNVNRGDASKQTPLMYAILYGYTPIIDELLETKKIDIDAQDGNGFTALMKAVYFNQPETVTKLLLAGADVSLTNEAGVTALKIAEANNFSDIKNQLRAAGATQNTSITPLSTSSTSRITVAESLSSPSASLPVTPSPTAGSPTASSPAVSQPSSRPASSSGKWESPRITLLREAERRAAEEGRMTSPSPESSLVLASSPVPESSPSAGSPLSFTYPRRQFSRTPSASPTSMQMESITEGLEAKEED